MKQWLRQTIYSVNMWHRLAWLPIPLIIALGLTLWALGMTSVHEPRYLLPVMNLLLTTTIAFFVAWMAWRSYWLSGSPAILLLGCAMLLFGLAGLVAPILIELGNVDNGVTVHNLSMTLAGLFHLAAALRANDVDPSGPRRGRRIGLLLGYGGAVLAVALVTLLATTNLIPQFYTDAGPTPLRQGVLLAATLLMLLASTLLLFAHRPPSGSFLHWYALSLALIATGLGVMLANPAIGSTISWVGRGGQYLGAVYMLIAVLVAARKAGGWEHALDAVLREARQRYDLLFEAADDGVLVHPLTEGREPPRFVSANPAICAMLGYSAVELQRMSALDLAEKLEPATLEREFATMRATGRLLHEKTLVTRDGRRIPTEINSRVFQSDGRAMVMSIVRDVTERKRAEEALRQAQAELEQRVEERTAQLRLGNAELQRRSDQLARLASELTLTEQRERRRLAQILHDHLQQLLVGAKMRLDVLERRVTDDNALALARVGQLIEESLQVSRSLTVELSPPILHERGLHAGLLWLGRWMQEKHGLTVTLDCNGVVDPGREDVRVLVFESVRELLFNVVKHAGVTQASIEVEPAGASQLRLTIADEGCGFDTGRLRNHAEHVDGGYGLTNVGERLALLRGLMEVRSRPGAGTRITITVPTRPDGEAGAGAEECGGKGLSSAGV